MDNNFLKQYIDVRTKLIDKATKFGLELDFKDSQYLFDLLLAYSFWPKNVLWKDVLTKVVELSGEDISDDKILNKVKQWTNRYFKRAINDGLIIKKNIAEDKRVVMFEWTYKGQCLIKKLNEK